MIARLMILVAFGSTLAQDSNVTNSSANSAATRTTMTSPTTTSMLSSSSSSSPSSSSSSSSSATSSSGNMMRTTQETLVSLSPPENCSACIQNFQKIYMNLSSADESEKCPPDVHLNDSCVSVVNSNNCSDIISLLYSSNSNLSLGLICTLTGFRVVKWANCTGNTETLRLINQSNTDFCRMGDFNCSFDNHGILRIHKFAVLEPFRKKNFCLPPTTSAPTIPLLKNPVGPSAITAIVVIICLAITGVLAGFFFWPKCHMSKPPPSTPKKKQPPPVQVEAINVVAYRVAEHSSTGVPQVNLNVSPKQIGLAA